VASVKNDPEQQSSKGQARVDMERNDLIFTLKVTAMAVLALILGVVGVFIQQGDILR
jgi:hypothetical protein